MIKTVQITFSDPSIAFSDCVDDLTKAVYNASWNLASRHDVSILRVDFFNDSLVLTMNIPADQIDGFNYGYHLRGVAVYLRKNFPEKYPIRRDGRLLIYKEV